MSLGAWGDEGDVPTHGRETAAFQELVTIRNRAHKWTCDFFKEINDAEQITMTAALELIDETIEQLDVKL